MNYQSSHPQRERQQQRARKLDHARWPTRPNVLGYTLTITAVAAVYGLGELLAYLGVMQ